MLPRFALALPAVLILCGPVSACEDTETFLFTCQTDQPERSLALCATEEDSGEGLQFTGVRFVYHGEKGDEIVYPDNAADGPKLLFFSHQFKAGLYQASVRFEKDGASYRLTYKDAADGDPAGPSGGLEIVRDGKTVQTIACGETPSFYFDQTRQLIACDASNPFGAAGCTPAPPEVP